MVVAGLFLFSVFLLFVAVALFVLGLAIRRKHKVASVVSFVLSVVFFSPTVFWAVVICVNVKNQNEYAQETIQEVGELNYYLFEGRERKALKLLEKGCDMTRKTTGGDTSLHLAAEYNLGKVAAKLIELGADANATNDSNLTPLHNARKPEIAELLIKNGADLEARTVDGYTPLCFNAANFPVAKTFIEHGADINARTNSNITPLHALCIDSSCTSDRIAFFLDHGADVNAVDDEGKTPFFVLIENENYCQKWQTENPYTLLQRGADPFMKDSRSRSAAALLQETIRTCEEKDRTQWISYAASKKLLKKITEQ